MLNRNAIAKTEKSECLLKRLCKTTLEKAIPLQIGTVVEVSVGQFVEWPTLDRRPSVDLQGHAFQCA